MMPILTAAIAASLGAVAAGDDTPANAAAAPNAEIAGPAGETSLDTVVVLGTARSNTTSLTSTAPVDVITPEQLQQTGSVTLNEALSKLHPSFNFPQGQNAVKGQGVRSASLRGVGPAYTLVLVNGKRRNPSALLANTDPWPAAQVVDINTIPISAVDHIEVLRDGAAAQYGSDAIAGVINIVLKKDVPGTDLTATYGGYTDGGGQTRDFLGTQGFHLDDGGFVNINLQRMSNANVDRSEADWRQLFPNGDPRNETYPAKYGQWGQAARDNWSALVNGELPLASTWTLYGWADYSRASTSDHVNPERVVKSNTQSPTATIPDQISETMVLPIYPNGYQPSMQYISTQWDAVLGVKHVDNVFGKLDIGVSFGRGELARDTYNSVNPSWGPASPTSFYLGSWKSRTTSVTADYLRDLPIPVISSAVLSAGALFREEFWGTGDFGDYIGYSPGPLAGQPVASLYAPGGIYSQYASQYPGVNWAAETAVVPATGSSTAGIQPIDASAVTRTVRGGYVGIDASITSHWDVGATGRYEDYSDFGGNTTYRFTTRYEITPAIALRGTYSSGFHAPSIAELGQQGTAYTGTFTNNGISILSPGLTIQFRPNDPRAALFGAKPLQPETSTTGSVGLVLRPERTSSVTVDAYDLKIKNVITNTDPIQGPNAAAAFQALGMAGYTQASYYLNAWDSRTRGVDVVAQKELAIATGALDLSLATSFLATTVGNVNEGITVDGIANASSAIGPSRIRDAETGVPKNKVIVDIRYTIGSWSVNATDTRYSSYRYNVGNVPFVATANGNIDQVFSPENYLDLGIDYLIRSSLKLSFLVQNVFDKYPDKYVLGNRASGIDPYSFIAPNGASGRFVQAGINYKL